MAYQIPRFFLRNAFEIADTVGLDPANLLTNVAHRYRAHDLMAGLLMAWENLTASVGIMQAEATVGNLDILPDTLIIPAGHNLLTDGTTTYGSDVTLEVGTRAVPAGAQTSHETTTVDLVDDGIDGVIYWKFASAMAASPIYYVQITISGAASAIDPTMGELFMTNEVLLNVGAGPDQSWEPYDVPREIRNTTGSRVLSKRKLGADLRGWRTKEYAPESIAAELIQLKEHADALWFMPPDDDYSPTLVEFARGSPTIRQTGAGPAVSIMYEAALNVLEHGG